MLKSQINLTRYPMEIVHAMRHEASGSENGRRKLQQNVEAGVSNVKELLRRSVLLTSLELSWFERQQISNRQQFVYA